jgi:hypothetical protein
MRTLKFYLIMFLTLPLLFSCSTSENRKGILRYEMETMEKSLGDTTAASKGFAKVKFVYPEIKEAINPAILDVLNTYVKDQILTALFKEGRYKQPEFFIENFFKEYKNYTGDSPSEKIYWSIERKVNVTYVNDRIACFEFFEFSHLGGAHPNMNYFYTVYDLVTGGRLTPKDIFTEGYEAKLTSLAEKKFREMRLLKPDASLSGAGFNFPGGKFTLNKNFGFIKNGVVFFYNPYEISSYALGSSPVVIPYNEIQDLFVKAFMPGAK